MLNLVKRYRKSNDLLEKIKPSLHKINSEIEEEEESFKQKMHDAFLVAKDALDILIESLKAELDNIRDHLFAELESKEDDMLSQMDLKSSAKIKCEQIKNALGDPKLIDELNEAIENAFKKLQKLRESLLKIDEVYKCDDSLIENLRNLMNIPLPQISTKKVDYYGSCEKDELKCLTQIKTKTIKKKNMHYIGHEILATKNQSGFNFWNVTTGEMIESFNMKHRVYLFLPDFKMAFIVNGAKKAGIKIFDLRTMHFELNETDCAFDDLGLSSEGLLICNKNKNRCFEMKFFKVNGLRLEATEFVLSGCGRVQFMKALHGNLMAVSCFHEKSVKIYNVAKKNLESCVYFGIPVMALEVVSDEKFVVLTKKEFIMVNVTTKERKQTPVEKDVAFESYKLFALKDGRFGVLGNNKINLYNQDAHLFSSIPLTEFHCEKQINSVIALDNGRIAVATNDYIKIFDFKGRCGPVAKRLKF